MYKFHPFENFAQVFHRAYYAIQMNIPWKSAWNPRIQRAKRFNPEIL